MSESNTFSLKAVAFGFVVDTVLTVMGILVGSIALAVVWIANGVKPEDMEAKADALNQDVIFLLATLAMGFACTVLGGYVAGRFARSGPVLHGAVVGFLSLLLGLAAAAAFWDDMVKSPDWYLAANFLIPIPVGAFGGYLASLHGPKTPRDDRDEFDRYDNDDDERDRYT